MPSGENTTRFNCGGAKEGMEVGDAVGLLVGSMVSPGRLGFTVGEAVGDCGTVGCEVGLLELGRLVAIGTCVVGDSVGSSVGSSVG